MSGVSDRGAKGGCPALSIPETAVKPLYAPGLSKLSKVVLWMEMAGYCTPSLGLDIMRPTIVSFA